MNPTLWQRLRWPLLTAAIVHAWVVRYFFAPVSSDIVYYLQQARSLLGFGRPLTVIAPLEDLSQRWVSPFVAYPVGFPFTFSTVLRVVTDEVWAALLLDWFWIAVAFVAWFLVMETIRMPLRARLLIWLAWALAYDPFQFGGPADWQSAALLAAATAVTARALAGGKTWVGAAAASGLLVGAAAFTRYAYWPLVPALPAALAFIAWRDRRPIWRETVSFSINAGACLASLAVWNVLTAEHMTVLGVFYSPERRGFFPEQLLRMFPFPAAAVGLDRAVGFLVPNAGALGPRLFLLSVSVGLAVIYVRAIARFWTGPARNAPPADDADVARRFVYLSGGLVTAGTLATLVAASLRFPPEAQNITSVMLERYWLPVMAPLAIVLAAELAAHRGRPEQRRFAGFALAVVGLMGATVWIGPVARKIRRGSWEPFDQHLSATRKIGNAIRRATGVGPPVYMDMSRHTYWGQGCAAANGVPIVRIYSSNAEFSTSAPVTLVLGMPADPNEDRIPELRTFARRHGARKLGRYRNNTIDIVAMTLRPGTYALKRKEPVAGEKAEEKGKAGAGVSGRR